MKFRGDGDDPDTILREACKDDKFLDWVANEVENGTELGNKIKAVNENIGIYLTSTDTYQLISDNVKREDREKLAKLLSS